MANFHVLARSHALATYSKRPTVTRHLCTPLSATPERHQFAFVPSAVKHAGSAHGRSGHVAAIRAVSSGRVDLSDWSQPSGFRGTGVPRYDAQLDFQLNGSFISGARGRPQGVVHFLGGAFAGATPQLTYSVLIKLLAEAGYTVISTPYAVTFKHTDCAAAVQEQFMTTLTKLRSSDRANLAPEGLPVHGMGHSNGALLHLLIGSLFSPQNASNVIISFNNKEVGDAIPVPLDPLREVVTAVRNSLGTNAPQGFEVLRTLAASVAPGQRVDEELLRSVAPLIDQIGSVFGEVSDGFVEFKPSPAENRALMRSQYVVPATLMVKFQDDSIDESEEMTRLLQQVQPLGTTLLRLPGSHVTPCGGDLQWQPGKSFSPADAIALGVRTFSQADIRRLADRVIGWLNVQSAGVSAAGQGRQEASFVDL